jgi:hypothetical protein
MSLKDQPNIESIVSGIELKPDGACEYVTTINTKLALNVKDQNHDLDAVNSLIAAAFEHMRQFGSVVNRIQIRQYCAKAFQ